MFGIPTLAIRITTLEIRMRPAHKPNDLVLVHKSYFPKPDTLTSITPQPLIIYPNHKSYTPSLTLLLSPKANLQTPQPKPGTLSQVLLTYTGAMKAALSPLAL